MLKLWPRPARRPDAGVKVQLGVGEGDDEHLLVRGTTLRMVAKRERCTVAPGLFARTLEDLGGVAVCRLAWRGDWEPARALVPALVSAGLLITGVTLVHAERCAPGPRLVYWLAVYAGAPLLALLAYVVQERRGAVWSVRVPLRSVTRTVAAISGGLLLGAGLLVLARPGALVALWPWPITTLMLRVFAAWFAGIGAGLLWFLVDDDWRRLALLPRLLVVAAGLDLAMLLAYSGDLTTHGPRLWLYGAHLVALVALGILLHWIQRQPQSAASGYPPPVPESS